MGLWCSGFVYLCTAKVLHSTVGIQLCLAANCAWPASSTLTGAPQHAPQCTMHAATPQGPRTISPRHVFCTQVLVSVEAAACAAEALQGELPALLGGQRVSFSGGAGRGSGPRAPGDTVRRVGLACCSWGAGSGSVCGKHCMFLVPSALSGWRARCKQTPSKPGKPCVQHV